MDIQKTLARQRVCVEELNDLLTEPGTGFEALRRLADRPDLARERVAVQRAYLGLMMATHDVPVFVERPAHGNRAMALVSEIDGIERDFIAMTSSPGERLQRGAAYQRVAWPRSRAQLRVGLAVRLGLQPRNGYDERSILESSAELDASVAHTFSLLGVFDVSAGQLVVALSRLCALVNSTQDGIIRPDDLTAVCDSEVSYPLLEAIASMFEATNLAVFALWKQSWRSASLNNLIVPHAFSAAEYRPLLRLNDHARLAPNPSTLAIAAEHLIDDLALARNNVWEEFHHIRSPETVRASRGRALELAAESAIKGSLARGASNSCASYSSVSYSTRDRTVPWSSVGEVDVLIGCGTVQIAIECKASGYNGRDVAPKDFLSRPLNQLRTWRETRKREDLCFATDFRGREYAAADEAKLYTIANAELGLEMVLTLDDFGLMPTASPLMFRGDGPAVDVTSAPIHMCLADLWEVCEVLSGRDLLTYLALRIQLVRSNVEHHLAEDGCLNMFLRTGQVYPSTRDFRDHIQHSTSFDPTGLFAWQQQKKQTDAPQMGSPTPKRSRELKRLLGSLSGSQAEVAHIVAASVLPTAFSTPGQDLDARLNRERPNMIYSSHNRSLLITDRLGGDLGTWTRSPQYISAILNIFRSALAPALVVVIHYGHDDTSIAVRGEATTLVEPMSGRVLLADAVFDSAAVVDRQHLKLDRYDLCPCGSGAKYYWCVREQGHAVPVARD